MLFHLYKLSRIGKFTETESIIVVTGGWGNYCLMGSDFLFGMVRILWKWIVMIVVQPCEYT